MALCEVVEMHASLISVESSFRLRWLGMNLRGMLRAFVLFLLAAGVLHPSLLVGQNSPQNGRPLLFLPGWCASPNDWNTLAEEVAGSVGKQSVYANQTLHLVYYDGTSVKLWPSGQDFYVLQPSERFFALVFFGGPSNDFSSSNNPITVAGISVLNKADEVAQVVRAITTLTHIKDVNVVAHSMGGLDARAYMQGMAVPYNSAVCTADGYSCLNATRTPFGSDIHKLITLDTPHIGAQIANNTDLLAYLATFVNGDAFGFCAVAATLNRHELEETSSLINLLNANPESQLPAGVPIAAITSHSGYQIFLAHQGDDIVGTNEQSIATLLPGDPSYFDHDNNDGGNPIQCPSGLAILHSLNCLDAQPTTAPAMESEITNETLGSYTSIQVHTTLNGAAWSGSVHYSITGYPAHYSANGISTSGASITLTDTGCASPCIFNNTYLPIYSNIPTGEYTLSSVSGGPSTQFTITPDATQTLDVDPSTGASNWSLVFTIAFTGRTTSSSTTTISASPAHVTQGTAISFTAKVQSTGGMPTGSVTFFEGNNTLGKSNVDNTGTAILSYSSLTAGTHSITAVYGGDLNFNGSTSSAVSVTVTGVSPVISVNPSSGTIGVTSFQKTGSGFKPNGSITLRVTYPDNEVNVDNRVADSTGSYSYPVTYSNQVGTYYQTDTDNTTGQLSNKTTWAVSALAVNDFSLQATPSSQSVSQSGSVGFNIATTTTHGSAQAVAFTVANVPSGLTASFSPTSVTSGSASMLTVSASSTAPAGTYTLTIVGTGTAATHTAQVSVTVTAAASGPIVTVSPTIDSFSSQAVGSVSSFQTVTLVNSGGGQLTLNSIGLTAGSDYILNLPTATPQILNPNVPFSFQVAFEPTATGTRNGQILIYDNAPNSPQVVTLTGTATPALPTTGTISVKATLNGIALPSSYNYGYTLTGPGSYGGGGGYSYSVIPGTYSIAFNGPSDLTLSSVTPSASQNVSAGGSVTFTLNFTSTADFYPPGFYVPSGNAFTPQVVRAGSTANYSVIINGVPPGSASVPVTLSVFGAPPTSSPVFNPQPTYCCSGVTLAVGTTSATPPGVYTLSLSGTSSSGITHAGGTSSLAVTAPPTQPVQLVSVSTGGAQANAASSVNLSAVSADGRYIVFSTNASNLVSGNTNGYSQMYVRDRQTGTTTPVSVSSNGVLSDRGGEVGSISADGRFAIFGSTATNLYPGSSSSTQGIYVRDLVLGATEREDVAPDGTPANSDASEPNISADGRYVKFLSNATNLVSGVTGTQVYLRDRTTGKTILASAALDGTPANAGASGSAISADGRFIAFDSTSTNLVSQNTNGLKQAFLRDVVAGTTVLVSAATDGTSANAQVFDEVGGTFGPLAMSADGRYIVFNSNATNLVSQAVDGSVTHLFKRDIQTQQTTLIDADSVGTPLGGSSDYSYPSISADGRFVSFLGFWQVLVRDTVANQTGVVSVANDGSAGNVTAAPACCSSTVVSPGGGSVVFASSATNLVANDTNGVSDVFVAQNPFEGSSYVQSLTLNSSSILGGSSVTGTITLNSPAPTGGASVTVWSNNEAAQPPAVVVVPAGATSAPVTISSSLVPSETVLTIMASYNGGSSVAVLTLEPAPELAVSPETWDFGYQAVNTTSSSESFALTNSGTAALAINSVQLATGQMFKISANTCGSSIVAGGSCSVSVTFDPSASGSVSDAIQISYGSPTATLSVSLTGNGAIPVAGLSPTTVSFGSQSMPGNSTAVATLSNSGNGPLSSISAGISGTNAGDFSISSDGCSGVTLPANSSCLVSISFSPQSKGNRAAALSIADSASGSPQTISLTGTGVQSTPTLLWIPSAASIIYGTPLGIGVLDATAIQNGSNIVGTSAYTATLTGGTPQVVTQATVLGVGTYTLTATFTPNDATDYTTATATVFITITPATPTVTVTPSSNSIPSGQSVNVTVTVSGAPTPTGSVTLLAGTGSFNGALVNGVATINVPASALSVGSNSLHATYQGDTNYNIASGDSSVTVTADAKTTPTVTVTPSSLSITTLQSLLVTIGVAGTPIPTGAVTLSGGGYTSAATTLTGGSATINIPAGLLAAGSDQLTATYVPDSSSSSTYNSALGTTSVTVSLPVSGGRPQINFLPAIRTTLASGGFSGIAVDGSGNVFVADGNSVKEILASGGYTVVKTLGSGFSQPQTVAVDGNDNVFVADPGNSVKNTASGVYEILAASGYTTVLKLGSGFKQPLGVAVDGSGDVFVNDPGNSAVYEILAAGGYTTVNALGSDYGSWGIAVDGSGDVFIADTGDGVVKEILAAGGYATVNNLGSGIQGGTFGVAVDPSGNVYFTDTNSLSVQELQAAGGYTAVKTLATGFIEPVGVAVDVSGNVLIADGAGNQNGSGVVKLDSADAPSLTFNTATIGSTSNDSPQTVTLWNNGSTPLAFVIPSSGYNPSISTNFTLNSSAATACPSIGSSASSGGTLAAGASCTLSIDFAPTTPGSLNGSLVLTDNNLNVPNATQVISLSGTGTSSVKTTPTVTVTPSSNSIPSGQSLNVTVTVSGSPSPTGTVTLLVGTGSFNGSLVNGVATIAVPAVALSVGSNSLNATYQGDSNYNTALGSSSVTVTAAKTTPTVTVTPSQSSIPSGQSLNVTVTVSGNPTPTGIVTLLAGTGSFNGSLVNGVATITVPAVALSVGSNSLNATYQGDSNYSTASGSSSVTVTAAKTTPTITWNAPVAITYGTPLSTAQLNATASVGGSYSYSPPLGTVLNAGLQTLTVNFTPTDTTNYNTTVKSVTLTVNKATPVVTWAAPTAITYGTPLSATQLNANSTVNGVFVYNPVSGSVLTVGSHSLSVTLTPTDTSNYTTATSSVQLTVNQTASTITWATPSPIVYGTSLSASQLNASASVPGTFAYNPTAGTVLPVGNNTLSVQFTPTDSADYSSATATVILIVNNPVPVISNISPPFTSAKGAAFTISVSGLGFVANSTAYWGTAALVTQFISSTQLTAQVSATNIANSGITGITVLTPAPGGGTSNPWQFEVDTAGTIPPSFTTVTATVTPGSTATYHVTLPQSATNVSALCLNLPSGATCSYSATAGTVTIATSSTTPTGTYQITVVFSETLPGVATAFVLLPFLLLPLVIARKKLTTGRIWLVASLGLVLMTVAATSVGCGGGGGATLKLLGPTHQVTSSGAVSLTVQ